MIYNDIKFHLCKGIMMTGLGIDDNPSIKRWGVDLFDVNEMNPQKPYHGNIIGPVDDIYMGNGHTRHPAPQQPFYGHCAGNGIRVRVDCNQNMIVTRKPIVKAA
jgi:hypothetical protein